MEINPSLDPNGYPETWTQQIITISGIGTDIDCRVAFRYFVPNGGPSGSNSNFIGIDALLIDEDLGVSESQITNFEHFYNASTKELTLSAEQPISQFNLYNILGQRVISQELSSTEEVVNLAALNTGVYLANVEVNGQVASFKVVKR